MLALLVVMLARKMPGAPARAITALMVVRVAVAAENHFAVFTAWRITLMPAKPNIIGGCLRLIENITRLAVIVCPV